MIEATRRVRHNGEIYVKGDPITDITVEEATALVENGSADWFRIKPEQVVQKHDAVPRTTTDVTEEVKQYHKGFGRYDIPGVGLIQGRDAAIEAFKKVSVGD